MSASPLRGYPQRGRHLQRKGGSTMSSAQRCKPLHGVLALDYVEADRVPADGCSPPCDVEQLNLHNAKNMQVDVKSISIFLRC
jgi:hypothetical protein